LLVIIGDMIQRHNQRKIDTKTDDLNDDDKISEQSVNIEKSVLILNASQKDSMFEIDMTIPDFQCLLNY
jgi:hypothetical protein